MSDGLGADRVVLAISSPETMRFAMEQLQPGGAISWVGMEVFLGAPDIPWDQAFIKNATISGGVAPVKHYLPELWPLLESGRVDPSPVLDAPPAASRRGSTATGSWTSASRARSRWR